MPTTEPILFQWPKPTEALELPGVIRTLNLYKPSHDIIVVADGMGSEITPGAPSILYLPMQNYKAIIMGWTVIGDAAAGSIVWDVWKAPYPTIPTVADTITAAAKPTLAAAQINQATDVNTWTDVLIAENDILAFQVDSVADNTRSTLILSIAKGDYR